MEQDIAKKYNRRIFPIYKALAWDALFYHPIIFLFLTQTKGFFPSAVLYAESLRVLFLLLSQIPSAILIKKIGSRKALILGNLLVTTQIFLMIFIDSFPTLVFVYFLSGLGFALKATSQHALLYDSVKSKKGKYSYANIDAKGSSLFYVVAAIASLFTGFLFVISNYLPIIISSLVFALATIISCRFEEVGSENKNEKITVRDSIKKTTQGLKHIIKSKRLRSLFLFMCIFGGTLIMISTYERSLLADLQIAPQYFGIIFAFLTMVSAIGARFQDKLHRTFKHKTLTFVSIPVFISFIVIGIITTLNIPFGITIIVVVLAFSVQHFLRAPYWTLNKKYSLNFTNSDIRTSILSASELIEGLGTSIIMFLAGLLLEHFNTDISYFIIGIAGLGIILSVLHYMKKRFGLSPEKYNKEEIKYADT